MPSIDDRSRKPFSPTRGLGQPAPSTGPLPSGENLTIPLPALAHPKATALVPMPPLQWSPVTTDGHMPVASITGTLVDRDAPITAVRTPIVIKGGKKRTASAELPYQAHKKRRLLFSVLGVCLLFLITTGTLFAATPLGREVGLNLNVAQFSSNIFSNSTTSYGLTVQATATAVYNRQTDGYVPPGGMITNGDGSLNWPVGQCTYWANSRYHQLTGFWVPWTGNADQWVAGARAAHGWSVSTTPHVPSIIVIMPYVQEASGYGHVAVVESINANGSVHTSNMNWFGNGGGFDKESFVDFNPGSGIYFVYHT
ncbi:MAG: CHAP domain-containing protein [Ktedonobacteraceae bacterium]